MHTKHTEFGQNLNFTPYTAHSMSRTLVYFPGMICLSSPTIESGGSNLISKTKICKLTEYSSTVYESIWFECKYEAASNSKCYVKNILSVRFLRNYS